MEPQRLVRHGNRRASAGIETIRTRRRHRAFSWTDPAKEHSAADWSYRPLPCDWRNYAALDVELLIELETKMRAELKRQGKMEWAQEEFDYALKEGLGPREGASDSLDACLHITEVMRDRQALAIVRALWTRRDELAREYDIAPTPATVRTAPSSKWRNANHNAAQFRSIRSINERVRIHTDSEQDKMFERYAPIQRKIKPSMWKNIIQDALALPPSEWPDVARRRAAS